MFPPLRLLAGCGLGSETLPEGFLDGPHLSQNTEIEHTKKRSPILSRFEEEADLFRLGKRSLFQAIPYHQKRLEETLSADCQRSL